MLRHTRASGTLGQSSEVVCTNFILPSHNRAHRVDQLADIPGPWVFEDVLVSLWIRFSGISIADTPLHHVIETAGDPAGDASGRDKVTTFNRWYKSSGMPSSTMSSKAQLVLQSPGITAQFHIASHSGVPVLVRGKFGLGCNGEISNFVEANRSPSERCLSIPIGNATGHSRMPEQLTLQQGLRKCCTVHHHKGALSSWADGVYGSCHEALTGSRLASNQYRCVMGCHGTNQTKHLEHLRAFPHQTDQAFLRGNFPLQFLDIGLQVHLFFQSLQGEQEFFPEPWRLDV